ncbi:MAG: polyprenyl synthetase family protein [Halioglobus sp.]
MSGRVAGFIQHCQSRLQDLLPQLSIVDAPGTGSDQVLHALRDLERASHYAVGSGGKRIRPVLVYAAAAAVNTDTPESALDALALAVELMHCYSLAHDDLPAMDDDDLRRGKPSLHRAFDEASAILVGDGLQARAFQLIAEAPSLEAGQKVAMLATLAKAAGPAGMVGGQFIDVHAANSPMDLPALQQMHELKTGALICASVALGGIAAGASATQLAALEAYASHIGLAFQVVDDVLDVEGDTATLGKTSGKDIAANKATYIKLLGLEGAKAQAQRSLAAALAEIESFGDSADLLRDLARYIVERDR